MKVWRDRRQETWFLAEPYCTDTLEALMAPTTSR